MFFLVLVQMSNMSGNINSYVVIKQEPLEEENNEVILPVVTRESTSETGGYGAC